VSALALPLWWVRSSEKTSRVVAPGPALSPRQPQHLPGSAWELSEVLAVQFDLLRRAVLDSELD
jgi:hypothetical protein